MNQPNTKPRVRLLPKEMEIIRATVVRLLGDQKIVFVHRFLSHPLPRTVYASNGGSDFIHKSRPGIGFLVFPSRSMNTSAKTKPLFQTMKIQRVQGGNAKTVGNH